MPMLYSQLCSDKKNHWKYDYVSPLPKATKWDDLCAEITFEEKLQLDKAFKSDDPVCEVVKFCNNLIDDPYSEDYCLVLGIYKHIVNEYERLAKIVKHYSPKTSSSAESKYGIMSAIFQLSSKPHEQAKIEKEPYLKVIISNCFEYDKHITKRHHDNMQ